MTSASADPSAKIDSPALRCRPVAKVRGPANESLTLASLSARTSSRSSRSLRNQDRADRAAWSVESASRHPPGPWSTGRSTSTAVARPIMWAPTPRAGSSGKGMSWSNVSAIAARLPRMSVPGREPIPVAITLLAPPLRQRGRYRRSDDKVTVVKDGCLAGSDSTQRIL